MSWEKKIRAWAVAHGMGALALGPVEATKRQTAVLHAAKWQRDQLRTGEAIERVARAINPAAWDAATPSWDMRPALRGDAIRAITALLGEDT